MKVSRNWLQNFFEAPLPNTEALAEALTFHAFEIDGIEKVGDDDILDVKVTPNRGHDCLSHRGIAKELSAILKLPLNAAKDPLASMPVLAPTTSEVTVSLQTPLCKRYLAGHMRGIKVGPSPQWLSASLGAVGQRSINNVVDATNLVMFNLGQPLHAFDARKLGSLALGVRPAKEGEEMEALDKKKYVLKDSMLVITAGDTPVGIAGVKGGMPAAIDESTTEIVIESANFDGVSVRKTAQALKLRTDASARFEQVLSPELCAYAMRQAVDLISAIAGGELAGFVDVYPKPDKQGRVSTSLKKINSVLGSGLTPAEVADALVRLGLAYKEEGGVFEVEPPFERLDIAISEDVVEEVGRLVGYDAIPATPLPTHERTPEVNQNFFAAEQARQELVAQGYSEVYTSVFAERGERAVANKIGGEKPYLRDSLLPGLTEALKKNLPQKDLLGLKEVKIFEIGTVWQGGREVVMLGTGSEKGGVAERELAPVSAAAYENLPLSKALRYQPFSRYPYIVRDVAIWCPANTQPAHVLTAIQKEAGELAVSVRLFDRFTKEGRVSLAFRIIFQSFERTLTEAEVNEIMLKIGDILRTQGFEIR